MKIFRFLLIVISTSVILLAACEKDPIFEQIRQDEMIINNDLTQLSRRVKIIEDGRLMPVLPVDFDGTLKGLKTETVPTKYQIYLRAEVSPPSYDDVKLQASHIKIVGNNAFVTYNLQGPEYLGGVDVFDISDIENPQLIQGVIFPEKDISSIDIDPEGDDYNKFIYLAGAYNLEYDTLGLSSSAVVERFIANQANQFKHLGKVRQFYDLPGFTGNDVRYHHDGDQALYVTSGSDGGLTILNNGMGHNDYMSIPYARSVDTDGTSLVLYSAEENLLHVMGMDGEYKGPEKITTGGEHFFDDKYLEAKSIVRLKDNLVLIAAGTGGMEIYDLNNGNKVGSLPRPEILDPDNPLDYVTNGVSVNNNLILVANGGSGVHIAELEGAGSENRSRSIGRFTFEKGSSANFVEANDNKVFVATGLGGLKILEIVELESTEICETLWDDIVALLPERNSIHNENHPGHNLYGEDLPGTIELVEDAPVFITFVHNGAKWHNSLGYYAYHKDNPPVSVDDVDKKIVYPFVNENSNNEPRNQGERVRLGGNEKIFEKGTVIGFYLVAQGWDTSKGDMVEGKHTLYTDSDLNPGGQRKHVLFLEDSCDDIVLGFEDQLDEDGSDEDFNDIILVISNGDNQWGTQINESINTDGLPRPEVK